ncbi:substrate-binding domain-containing protein [Streptomyces sp. TS71-3]|uniref:substrate-binding domain-containing protein n=1 Tax=Streptomyces sp. TS71-3 TaxID=2733862 RepID=UPI001B2EA183|nr:substrate-binding domain-containing protein [Streptomyces sp. TS71-3]GHJ42450.1 LacI family transcriptional regulator [Streptomyces sp. TS71-3]
MRDSVDVRRRRILAAVDARGAARVTELASELGVSVVTVRRDVEELERAGKLTRGHGVARSVAAAGAQAPPAQDPPGHGAAVGVIVPERHSYLYEALHGTRSVLEEAGLRIALHIAPIAAGAERPLVERALAGGARGLIIAPRWRSAAAEEADYGWLAALDVPTVLMERRPRSGSALHALDSVCSDHWYGTHLAVDHLVSLGHRRIVLAARNDSPTARAIRAAFAEIAATRPEVEDWSVALSSPDAAPFEPGADGTGDAAGHTGPLDLAAVLRERGATAAVLHGDVDALMLVQRLMERGVRVPRDCSVVAYDDGVAALGSTPLTAVAPPKAEIGRAAAELLLRRLGQPEGSAPAPVRRLELLPELKRRGSAVAAPPGSAD